MRMKTCILTMSFLCASLFAVCAETMYTINGWPEGLKTIPCDAFERMPDGSWAQTGTIIVQPENNTMSHNRFKNTGETRILEQRCNPPK